MRFCNVLGPDIRTSHARLLSLPAVPTIARLRPALPVHPRRRRRRRARVRGRATTSRASTTSRRDGVLALSEVIGLLGKRAAAGAAAVRHRPRRVARCGGLGVRIPPEMLNQLRYGRGLDNRRLKAAGFRYRYTTREAVQQVRRAPAAALGAAGRAGAVPLREGGRGLPALEPERARARGARRAAARFFRAPRRSRRSRHACLNGGDRATRYARCRRSTLMIGFAGVLVGRSNSNCASQAMPLIAGIAAALWSCSSWPRTPTTRRATT